MTAYYQPLARKDDGRFDYTRGTGSSPAYSIGYCAGGTGDGDPAKYHDDGHATAEEACACYRAWCLDARLRFGSEAGTQKPCKRCGAWTQGRGSFFGDDFVRPVPLCDQHQTRADMEAALVDSKEAP